MTKRSMKRQRSMRARKSWLQHRARRRRLLGAIIFLFMLGAGALVCAAVQGSRTYKIVVEAKSCSIRQGESMPQLTASVLCEEDQKHLERRKLDRKTGYTAWNFIQDLRKGKYYQLECDSDGVTEGTYPIRVRLDSGIEKKLTGKNGEWKKKLQVILKDASMTVQNQLGEWQKDRFKKWDGTYVQNDFVTVKGKTYYLDENGKKTKGWKEIGVSYYHFDDDGAMESDKWADKGNTKAYLTADGKAASGWMDIDGHSYFFNRDAEMETGRKRIGTLECVFRDDGTLESEKSSIDPDKPMMALTFDDGPGQRTPELLEALKKYGGHATFFLQGVNIPGREDTVKKILEAGCEIGNHSFNHPELTKLSEPDIRSQIGKTDDLIKGACGQGAGLLRPPYGAVNDTVKKNAGVPLILWNIDTLDWKEGTKYVVDHVLQTADDGDIVLMHDTHSTSVDAALQLLPVLAEKGYQLVTVSEMAHARGIDLKPGTVYTDFNR